MTAHEIRETLRQMLADWDALTPAERFEALHRASGAAQRAEICDKAAKQIIAELHEERHDVILGLQADLAKGGGADFVFIEEGIDGAMRDLGYAEASEAMHHEACGQVFSWLREQHGIEPPAWWLRRRQPGGGRPMAWSVSFATSKRDGELAFSGSSEEVIAQVETLAKARGLAIEIDAFTDEIHAWTIGRSRRRRWLCIQCEG